MTDKINMKMQGYGGWRGEGMKKESNEMGIKLKGKEENRRVNNGCNDNFKMTALQPWKERAVG